MSTHCVTAFDLRESAAAPARTKLTRGHVEAIVAAAAYVLLLPAASVLMAFLTP